MRVAVIGAGMAGLTAARSLADQGHTVTVLDKGRSPGGRMATRRIDGAHLDHGPQFFTVRTEAFSTVVDRWRAEDRVRHWCDGFGSVDGHPRYVGTAGMNALAKSMAEGLDVRCDRLVFTVRPGRAGHRWSVVIDDATEVGADAVVLTCPLPQSASLLVDAGVDVPEDLWRIDYDRTLALLTVLDAPSAVPPPGGRNAESLGGTPFSFIGDQTQRGVSTVPSVTFHAGADWSAEHWDADPDTVRALLLEAAAPWIGPATVTAAQVKRWRFATPQRLWPEPCWTSDDGSVVLAGDAFAGPKATGSNLEGAFTSGRAAATVLAGRDQRSQTTAIRRSSSTE